MRGQRGADSGQDAWRGSRVTTLGDDGEQAYLRIQDLTKVYSTRDGPVRVE